MIPGLQRRSLRGFDPNLSGTIDVPHPQGADNLYREGICDPRLSVLITLHLDFCEATGELIADGMCREREKGKKGLI